MLDQYFIFDGMRSKSAWIELQRPIKVSAAVPNVESVTIPGRNGVLHQWDGTYKNRTITADCYLLSGSIYYDITKINSHLLTSQAYRKLIISGDERHFFMARPTGGISEDVRRDIITPFTLTFDAKPQRYLVSGEREVSVTNSSIYNPTAFDSSPIIKITASGVGPKLTINGNVILFASFTGEIIIDAETGNAVQDGVNVNGRVFYEFDEDLKLVPGENIISVNSGASVNIIPRWWEL